MNSKTSSKTGNDSLRTLKQATAYIIDKLKLHGVKLLRYDSYGTRSIYLKIDYGVGHSIRISDHSGKKHLKYRYNLRSDLKTVRTHEDNGFIRHYYPLAQIDKMLEDILDSRTERMNMYGVKKYTEFMQKNKRENRHNTAGFWSSAREV